MNGYEAKQAAKKEGLQARIDKLKAASTAAYDQASKMQSIIPFGQPILVGHYSEGRDRNYRKRIGAKFDRSFALQAQAEKLEQRLLGVGSGGISSDDPEATAKLEDRIAKLTVEHQQMVAANNAARANGQAATYAGWALSNNSANIRRLKERLIVLGVKATRQTTEGSYQINDTNDPQIFKVRRDVEENRIMLIFPGKPEEAIRAKLKKFGFKWSPTRGAWVRQMTPNAEISTSWLIKELTNPQEVA